MTLTVMPDNAVAVGSIRLVLDPADDRHSDHYGPAVTVGCTVNAASPAIVAVLGQLL